MKMIQASPAELAVAAAEVVRAEHGSDLSQVRIERTKQSIYAHAREHGLLPAQSAVQALGFVVSEMALAEEEAANAN